MYKRLKILPIVILLVSCKRTDTFPYYPVFLEFNITVIAPELKASGGYKEFTAPLNYSQRVGLGGILVFHNIEDKFFAFDMACPNEQKTNIKVHCNTMGIAVCDSCGSQFLVSDGLGFVLKGQAKIPLQKYNVYYSAYLDNLVVRN